MSHEGTSLRLERMEEKIDKLSEAIVALARVEEKIINLEQTNAALMKQIMANESRTTKNEEAITSVRLEQSKDSSTLQSLRKLFWIFVTSASAGGFIAWFKVFGKIAEMAK